MDRSRALASLSHKLPPQWGLAFVYAVMVLARTTVIALIPIMAYRVLGTAQSVSQLYFLSSLIGITVSLALPRLLRTCGRWRVFCFAALCGLASALALANQAPLGLAIGLTFHVLMVLIFENIISLYILQHIPRRSLSAFEPRRVFLAGIAYGLGPWMGVWLTEHVSLLLPLAASAALALVVPLILAHLDYSDKAHAESGSLKRAGLRDARHYFSQPRLLLAWILATVRASWWAMYIIYTPILALTSGLGTRVGGFMVAFGSALLVLAPFWGRVASRIGMRRLMVGGYLACGCGTLATGLWASQSPWWAMSFLAISSFAMSAIDGMGNILFLRAVRPLQRTAMTPIFTTYRDVAQIAPTGIFAIILSFLPLPTVFVASGIVTVAAAFLCRHISRRF